MIAVCDIGGSKGDWGIIDGNESIVIESAGFNPFIHDPREFELKLKNDLKDIKISKIKEIYYYGTGCREESSKQKIRSILSQVFTNARLHVDIDLLASARATCGHQKGIACILGTGANSGLYDGKYLLDNVPTLGYMCGDEGSGAYLGKLLLRSYFYRDLPLELKSAFEEKYPGKHEFILNGMYKQSAPNQFLASFSTFIADHLNHIFIQNLLDKSFQDYIDTQLSKYEAYQTFPANFVGSIAFHFKPALHKVLEKNGISLGKVISKPIHDLIKYHIEDENH